MWSLSKTFLGRWGYERIPMYSDRLPTRAKSSPFRQLATVAVVFSATALLWLTMANLRQQPYNPLDNYQSLNSLSITIDSPVEHSPASRRAVVSSLFSDGFAIAVAVAGYSTRSANISARLLLPYLEDQVSKKALCIVRTVGWEPYPVPRMPPPHGGKGIHPRFKDLYTKLNMWNLDQHGVDSAVFIDADTLVRRNFDELFDSPYNFAAVPDVYGAGDPRGFSLTFNSGVIAYRPSSKVYEDMRRKLEIAEYPPKQADQAFLNLYFAGTSVHLPYIYNANLAIKARSPVLWERLADEMRVVHYTTLKPFIHNGRSSNAILTPAEIEEAVEQGARRESGFFEEEVGWWKAAYQGMMFEYGNALRECTGTV
ncbi:glycosyltransferase family 8 protein [Mycena sanguinolenta]|nr:glycosyltransferase family 8 protein [Mycena sanguinolenta]